MKELTYARWPHEGTPTLEQLIIACGAEFGLLDRTVVDNGVYTKWHASNGKVGIDSIVTHGPTPIWAVARLWLALQVQGPKIRPPPLPSLDRKD